MMDEYITKQEARAALLQGPWKPNEWHVINILITSIPPADVRPVVRGVWRFEKQGPEDYEQFWRCSVCADKTYFITNYCHNCGADMRGGDADGEEKD